MGGSDTAVVDGVAPGVTLAGVGDGVTAGRVTPGVVAGTVVVGTLVVAEATVAWALARALGDGATRRSVSGPHAITRDTTASATTRRIV